MPLCFFFLEGLVVFVEMGVVVLLDPPFSTVTEQQGDVHFDLVAAAAFRFPRIPGKRADIPVRCRTIKNNRSIGLGYNPD